MSPRHLVEVATAAGVSLIQQAAYQTARALLEQVECMVRTAGDEDGPAAALALRSLGRLEEELGHSREAIRRYEAALAIERAVYGPSHPEVAVTLRNLGNARLQLPDSAAAIDDYRAALRLQEGDDAEWARTAVNVGQALQPLDGLPFLVEALSILEHTCGREHPQVARALLNIGVTFHHLERPEDAIPLYERAERMFHDSYGGDHPAVADVLANLGVAHVVLEQYDLAIDRCYPRAAQIYQEIYGPNHHRTSWVGELLKSARRARLARG